jgi:hypothetical protein
MAIKQSPVPRAQEAGIQTDEAWRLDHETTVVSWTGMRFKTSYKALEQLLFFRFD